MAHEGKLKLVKLNIDSFPQLTQGLNIRSVPSVFLIFKGQIVDMVQGMVEPEKLDEFINTGLLVAGIETNENLMQDVVMKIQRFIEDGDYKQVIQVCQDSLQLDAWRQAVGTELILSWTYCMLFE